MRRGPQPSGPHGKAPIRALGAALALWLFLPTEARSEEIPSGVVWTHKEQNNWVHIYKNPSYDSHSGDHSVLVLGLNSTEDVVKEQSAYVNPSTGRPYDVVIGLAAPDAKTEYERVFWKDHFDARENAGAVGAAIAKAFGGKIDAATVDMHSNGNAVGIALLEKNLGFTGVRHLDMMAPDEGFRARNLDPDRLSGIVASHRIESIDVFVNSGDVVPKFGDASKRAADEVAFENVSAKGIPIRRHAFDYQIPRSIGDHFLAAYLALRAIESADPEVIEAMRKSIGEDNFQAVARVVAATGGFGRQIRKRSEELKASEGPALALIGEAEGNLRDVRAYQKGLSLPGEQPLMDASAALVATDEETLGRLHGQVDLIEKALACLAQIIARPAEPPDRA